MLHKSVSSYIPNKMLFFCFLAVWEKKSPVGWWHVFGILRGAKLTGKISNTWHQWRQPSSLTQRFIFVFVFLSTNYTDFSDYYFLTKEHKNRRTYLNFSMWNHLSLTYLLRLASCWTRCVLHFFPHRHFECWQRFAIRGTGFADLPLLTLPSSLRSVRRWGLFRYCPAGQ